ncbi:hypothetical protein H681_25215 [Pseudomonas sp. ATCC 13867]|uniref:DUF3313 domain-containing protein n=1 Tax=Pseudomonas sp. ATCC 13867 TaxID=1294143 RepID=UPI0002C4E184|nr:DUF3313 domain-containing protein [Pseudomonas sp. ATCC 13867]AGI26910.1 hypothetical protein H681_25215 [Pseudomonas sp. ATCC 13867]RFQ25938.1 DUF3313 domain-containing protein [Pseudomonas sp. ATCC 13867]
MTRLSVVPTLLLAGALALGGCSSQKPDASQYSGFLDDYSQLKPATSPSGQPVLRWVDPNLKLNNYSSVLVERPVYYPQPKPSETIDQTTLNAIPDYLKQQIEQQLSSRYRIVQQADRDTLVLKTAITGVNVSTEGLHAYEVIPIALVVAATTTAIGTRDQDTEVYVEMEALDGATSKPVAKVVRKGAGETLENASTHLTLNDLKPVLDGWARDAANFKP